MPLMLPREIIAMLRGWLGHARYSSVEERLVALEVFGRTQNYDRFIPLCENIAREPGLEQRALGKLGEICEEVYSVDQGPGRSVSILVRAMRLALGAERNCAHTPEEVRQLAETCAREDGAFDPEGAMADLLHSERGASLCEKKKLVIALARGLLRSDRRGIAALDLYTFLCYAGRASSLRASEPLVAEATFSLANLLEENDGAERITADIYRRALSVRPDPSIFVKLLESCFKREMYDEVRELIANAPEGLLDVGALEIGSLGHLEASDLYAHVVRGVYLKVLERSDKEDLKERVAQFLCKNLGILEEKLQKEVTEAIEKSLFNSEMPDQAKAERIFSTDSWEIMRHFATSPFLKLSLEHFAAKADLEDYRERAYKIQRFDRKEP